MQVIGGIVLHQGRISEMKTGEGKTLVATLPAYLNALTGNGVHIVTVNDYLARRDSEWMGKVYRFLGLSVGLIVHDMDNDERRKAYAADITYGTNNEFGFDYLRDNMVIYKESLVQRGHSFAIVDEVDSILIDEARTPLIISGQGDKSTDLYQQADTFTRTLHIKKVKETDDKEDADETYADADYIVDEKAKTATLTQNGTHKAEAYFHDRLSVRQPERAGCGIQRGEKLILHKHPRIGEGVHQGGLAGVGVADDRRGKHAILSATAAKAIPLLLQLIELTAQCFDSAPDMPPVGFELAFARSPGADTAAQAGKRRSLPGQPRQHIPHLRQLHLQRALSGPRAGGKDIKDQRCAVNHANFGGIFNIALLNRAKFAVKDQQVDRVCLAEIMLLTNPSSFSFVPDNL